MALRAPFPWFGGKSRAAHLVWAAFGDTPNYVEPFAGSLAVMLARPTAPRIETVNDLDCFLANFWRAVTAKPEFVAQYADWPVNEADLHARHKWLVNRKEFRERMRKDPAYFDAKIAGWWVWGICQWIGSGWCASGTLPNRSTPSRENRRPHLSSSDGLEAAVAWEGRTNAGRAARGVNTAAYRVRPDLSGARGLNQRSITVKNEKRPHLWRGGMGVHSDAAVAEKGKRKRDTTKAGDWKKRPVLAHGNRGVHLVKEQLPHLAGDSGAAGRGIHASGKTNQKLPKMDRGTTSRMRPVRVEAIYEWMEALADRLRRVRVCCGDWKRVLGPSSTEKIGVTGIFLDPPYSTGADRDPSLYNHDDLEVAHAVREWALANGDNPKLRIALAGYEGEHKMPESWRVVSWKANGGYAASAGNTANSYRERIWFSPHCLGPQGQIELFA
jgi:site-specific DNA-adenine methylase